ncbi:hypothetical protein MASR2M17_02220 [Aminivibrio sp.]
MVGQEGGSPEKEKTGPFLCRKEGDEDGTFSLRPFSEAPPGRKGARRGEDPSDFFGGGTGGRAGLHTVSLTRPE